MSSYEYFGFGLEDAFGFGISPLEEIDDGYMWHVATDRGEACLKRFRGRSAAETSAGSSLYVHERGFKRTPRLISAADGRPYVRSPMTDPVWYLALFEWVRAEGSEPAPTLREWQNQVGADSGTCRRVAEDLGSALGQFHEASRGFCPWSIDREADFWVWSIGRIRLQARLARSRLATEDRPEIRELVSAALENCEPFIDGVVETAEQSLDLFRDVMAQAREREDVRHCDLHLGNFLIGADGLMLIDLAELEPSPRIYKDPRCLWSFGEEEAVLSAVRAYCAEVKLTQEEIDLFPIINDPIDSWRRFLDGYLSGDWTEEMMLNYSGNIQDYARKKTHMSWAAEILRECTG